MRPYRLWILSAMTLACLHGQNIYVDVNLGNNAAPGTSPATAVKTIQMGLYRAAMSGPTYTNVFVTAAVYTSNNGGLSNLSKAGVFITNHNMRLLGGWDSGFAGQVGTTELDAGGGGLCHVVMVSNANKVILERFTLRGGNAAVAPPDSHGGGLHVRDSAGGFYNILILNNTASGYGGGFYFYNSHSNHLIAQVNDNGAGSGGAGGYVDISTNNTIAGSMSNNITVNFGGALGMNRSTSNAIQSAMFSNKAAEGGGVDMDLGKSNRITGFFLGNVSTIGAGGGGGVCMRNGFWNRIEGNFSGNIAVDKGGAIYVSGETNLLIAGVHSSNVATNHGGGLSSWLCVGMTVAAQWLSNQGGKAGAVYLWNGTNNAITGTVAGNSTWLSGGAMLLVNVTNLALTNCVFTNNTGPASEAVLVLSNTSALSGMLISNCVFAGTNGSRAVAIKEQGNNTTGHFLVNNLFVHSALGYLYSNATGPVATNLDVAALNLPGDARHDAVAAYGNFLQPPFTAVYVDITNGSQWNSGMSPLMALRNIQHAVSRSLEYTGAPLPIKVAAGTYTSNNGGLTNLFQSGVFISNHNQSLSGAWEPFSFASQSGASELDGESVTPHVVTVSNATNVHLSRLTLLRGYTTSAGGCAYDWSGGGLNLFQAHGGDFDLTVSNHTGFRGAGFSLYASHSNRLNLVANSNGAPAGYGAGGFLDLSAANTIEGALAKNAVTGGAAYSGGALYLNRSHSNRIRCSMTDNFAVGRGGAAYLVQASSNRVEGDCADNAATNGGALYLDACTNTALAGNFVQNAASNNGGGVYLKDCLGTGATGACALNRAVLAGGGVFMSNSHEQDFSVSLTGNAAPNGGGAYLHASHSNRFAGTMASNSAGINGGAVFLFGSCSNRFENAFLSNTTGGYGGAIQVWDSQSNLMLGDFVGNRANYGGAVALNNKSAVNGLHGNMLSNSSLSFGGAISIMGPLNTVTGRLECNSTAGKGGAVGLMNATANGNVIAADMVSNAAANGGAVAVEYADTNTIQGLMSSNAASAGGGAVYLFTARENTLGGAMAGNRALAGGAVYLKDSRRNTVGGFMSWNAAGYGGALCMDSGNVSNRVTGGMFSNRAESGPGGAYFERQGIGNLVSASICSNATAFSGGGVFLQDASNFSLIACLLSNNLASDAIVVLSNFAGLNSALLQSNRFFGTSASAGFAILETGNGTAGHALLDNFFYTNTLGFLYSNVSVVGDVISNHEIAVLNTPASLRHNAALASNNHVATALVDGMVYAPPLAAILSPAVAGTNGVVLFSSATSGGTRPITNYTWNFGDGFSSNGPDLASVTHAYTAMLTNFVSLTVWDDFGASSTASNAIFIGGFVPIAGRVSGKTTNGVYVTLRGGNADVSNSTGTSGAGLFQFWVTNGIYALIPSKYGYRFSPSNKSVTVNGSGSDGQEFAASEIIPILGFAGLTNHQEVVRDLPIQFTNDAPEMFTNGIAYWVSNVPGTAAYASNLMAAMGESNALDTTLFQDGYYVLGARAIDSPFGRTNFLVYTLFFNNQIFKVLGKGLETKRALIYNTVRRLPAGDLVELFFHIEASQAVRIAVYDKRGRLLSVLPEKTYPKGPNRVAWENVPKNLEAGVYYARFDCDEFSKAVPIVFLQE